MNLTEKIFALLAIIISVLIYFAGVHRGELKAKRDKQKEEDSDSEDRIMRVEGEYMKNALAKKTSGLHGLILAGVSILKNDSEIRDVCKRTESRGQKSPLGSKLNFDGINLHEFFSIASERGYDFLKSGSAEVLLDELRNIDKK